MKAIIEKWKINQNLLASKMGMSKGYFNNKISESQTNYRFTQAEKIRLKEILLEMRDDLSLIENMDI